jgi:hypothetical protein
MCEDLWNYVDCVGYMKGWPHNETFGIFQPKHSSNGAAWKGFMEKKITKKLRQYERIIRGTNNCEQ